MESFSVTSAKDLMRMVKQHYVFQTTVHN